MAKLRRIQKARLRHIAREKWNRYCQSARIPSATEFEGELGNGNENQHPLIVAVRNDPKIVGMDLETILLMLQLAWLLYQLWSRWKQPEPSTVIDAEEWRVMGESIDD